MRNVSNLSWRFVSSEFLYNEKVCGSIMRCDKVPWELTIARAISIVNEQMINPLL